MLTYHVINVAVLLTNTTPRLSIFMHSLVTRQLFFRGFSSDLTCHTRKIESTNYSRFCQVIKIVQVSHDTYMFGKYESHNFTRWSSCWWRNSELPWVSSQNWSRYWSSKRRCTWPYQPSKVDKVSSIIPVTELQQVWWTRK